MYVCERLCCVVRVYAFILLLSLIVIENVLLGITFWIINFADYFNARILCSVDIWQAFRINELCNGGVE